MKIAIVGYGKMGRMIEAAAINRGNEVVATIDIMAKDASVLVQPGDYKAIADAVKNSGAEGVIEFSHPSSVMGNINAILPLGIPVVVGTTGWNDKYDEVKEYCKKVNGTIMTSSNFSIGVNMFFKIVEEAVKIMGDYDEYDVSTWEMHHNQKADSPSGTALEIARRIMENDSRKTEIEADAFHSRPEKNVLHVSSTRCGSVPGTHTVFFDSNADSIELTHRARSREGFALGSVIALENLSKKLSDGSLSKGGFYGMSDVI